ncbi:transcription antitermination factor NusG [Anseongella ginsenosidimutans]|uniref:Transcription antitermination factor NusG n=1 Tax=Anseongella ginsenosidimutans TaxID=496056 RepID=A0A4R3KSQ8_9SPHI|nr:UpxY family transcription antiterminator [Anseongella ginsenosidimutans]QEC53372.1 UpxY family transcription antiterminator [Anseongella ginsenosidimutans]TCS88256.1 transcription antitermination factor NusG [Anseongella ginsenosidimutans]
MTESVTKRKWYVVYTRSRWEKKADQLLKEQGIRSFCPVVKTQRKWADRNKTVEFPLFSSYLFVYADLREQVNVRQTAGIVNFVYHCGKPAVISENEIERIHDIIQCYPDVETMSLPAFQVGDKVKMKNGELMNWKGEIVEIHGKSVVMIIEPLNCALVAKVKVPRAALAIQ